MDDAKTTVTCEECGRVLTESPSVPTEEREPCPSCGSRARHVHIEISDTLTVRDSVIVAAGPVFAFVQPVTHIVETQPPESGLHVEANHDNPVAAGTEILLVFLVIVVGGWTLITRYVRVEPRA